MTTIDKVTETDCYQSLRKLVVLSLRVWRASKRQKLTSKINVGRLGNCYGC